VLAVLAGMLHVALHDITAIREGSASFLLDKSFLGSWFFGHRHKHIVVGVYWKIKALTSIV
jgi:hypothetical protein